MADIDYDALGTMDMHGLLLFYHLAMETKDYKYVFSVAIQFVLQPTQNLVKKTC